MLSSSTPRRGRRQQQSRACLACQRRKSRCKTEPDLPSKCMMCRFHGTECTFARPNEFTAGQTTGRPIYSPRPQQTQPRSRRSLGTPGSVGTVGDGDNVVVTTNVIDAGGQIAASLGRVPHSHGTSFADSHETPFSGPSEELATSEDEIHIVGPVNSGDTRLIADYLSNSSASAFLVGGSIIKKAPVHAMGHYDPVMFNAVRRRPLRTMDKESTASTKCQIVEQVIGPFCSDLIDVYFNKVHVCFPLLDQETFKSQYYTSKRSISPSLLANLYANVAVYGRNSDLLPAHWCPDVMFIWNQANEALYSELHLAPSISILIAILLNISGRPLTSIIGNNILLGSAIAIAHALGLNRNCLDWDISPADKCLRVRLWWALFVYDKWSSVAYGTPPNLNRTAHNVPAPSVDILYESIDHYPSHTGAASIHIHLITLTQVLDMYLEHIFCLHQTPTSTLFSGENKLTTWEDSLPQDLRRIVLRGVDLQDSGSCNLRLAYLYVKLLDRRLEADLANHQALIHGTPTTNRLTEARRAAEEIVSLVQELDNNSINDYWLPLCAFVLSSTVAFLLRCALEIEHQQVCLEQSISLKLAAAMIEALQSHRQRFNWDIGDICLAQYADITEKLASSQIQFEEAIQQFRPTMLSNATNINDAYLNLWEFA